jgi:hypothetical protein
VAFTYELLVVLHIVFDLFFALSIVCAGRGLAMAIQGLKPKQRTPRLIVMRYKARNASGRPRGERGALPEPIVAVAQ